MTTITALPTPPSRDDPATFATRGDAFMSALPTFATQANTVAGEVNVNAGTATTQAGIATAGAGTATTKAGEALTSANNAAASEANAAYMDAKYLGSKSSNPTLDNHGGALISGALYFNTVVPEMRVWSGSAWVATYVPTSSYLTTGDIGVTVQGNVQQITYTSRSGLRAGTPSTGSLALVPDLGVLVFDAASTEYDDDETCFATSNGRWLLVAMSPDMVYEHTLGPVEDLQTQVSAQARHFLYGSFAMSLTTLATLTSSDFTATVTGAALGDLVIVTPGNAFGTSAADKGALHYSAYVSAINTVTVSIRNASATSAAMTASSWSILVIKT